MHATRDCASTRWRRPPCQALRRRSSASLLPSRQPTSTTFVVPFPIPFCVLFFFTPLSLQQEPLNLVPKKRNWDLKRDMAGRIARLDRRTQAAVVELLRQRAQEAGDDDDEEEEEEDDEKEKKEDHKDTST